MCYVCVLNKSIKSTQNEPLKKTIKNYPTSRKGFFRNTGSLCMQWSSTAHAML